MKWLPCLLMPLLLAACDGGLWNNPYPAADKGKPIFYTAFTERPKHLDPAQAYSENEYIFLAQIYLPPLQYHYLKRPYTLVPQAAIDQPAVRYLDKDNRPLPDDAPADKVAYSEYEIRLRPDQRYQSHPAFARDAQGRPEYLALKPGDLRDIHALNDFPHSGTREVRAADYVYQIKRLAHPSIHSPIAGLMAEYVVGLKAYADTLKQAQKAHPEDFLDLGNYPLEGAQEVDEHTYRIKVYGKYPQFAYWLAMPFFAPMPVEAERFYEQPGMRERNITLDWWPVGSGPYYLSENNPNQRMVLSRNPNFSGEHYPAEGEPGDQEAGLLADAGKALPLIDKVVFSLEKETIPYWNKFLQGYYDASGISSDSFDQAVQVNVTGETNVTDEMKEQGITLSTSVATSTMYMGFNWLDPVVGGSCASPTSAPPPQPSPDGRGSKRNESSCNPERASKLRRAIAIAVDFEEFISI
ncbi:MAG: peptide ABC transporter substrate-binding protein, partial [Nitrosomonadales bacterium]|nr:peptide ABC transporter substrate-binding protein [Nitrosomonadales bacterium]